MNKPKNRSENIVVQEFAGEILIYDLKINKAYCLNETSALIWQLCDGTKTVAEIRNSLTKKMKQPLTEDVIWLALDDFKKDNLLEQSDQFEIEFNGLSRRQIIKKVGFASMIMLPLISSIVAPSSAHAQSGPTNLALNSACSNSGQCASGFCHPNSKCCVPGTVNSFSPGQGNTGVGFGGDCATLTQAQLNAQCSFIPSTSCCSGTPWVSTGSCSPIAAGLVSTVCNCS